MRLANFSWGFLASRIFSFSANLLLAGTELLIPASALPTCVACSRCVLSLPSPSDNIITYKT